MDQAQVKALAAIQPFVHEATTSKSASPRYLADLITRATSASGTYFFTELLQTSAIQSLRNAEASANSYLALLEIFSWGTYEEYKNTPNLPDLTAAQSEKLKQLTLLTLASPFAPQTNPPTDYLTYTALTSALSLPSNQALESLLTKSIYAGLLTARLSPTSTPPAVHITSVAPLRDLRPQSLPALLQILQTWESRCSNVISDLENEIGGIRSSAARRSTLQKKRQDVVDNAVVTDGTDGKGNGTAMSSRLRTRQGNKRDLDEQMDGDDDGDLSSDMDVDYVDVPSSRGSAMVGASRGAKRNRGRG